MDYTEKVLKSLCLAGVEWEMSVPISYGQTLDQTDIPQCEQTYFVPKSSAPKSDTYILECAENCACNDNICDGIKSFSAHPLFSGAKNTILPSLVDRCPVLIVTDTPSLSDDQCGQILSGTDGELFDKMLSAVGLSRDQVSITPLVFWRPAGGRAPTASEISFCKPFINKIIEQIQPKQILTLGTIAAQEIAGATLPRDHGKEFNTGCSELRVIPIYKPDFVMKNPNVKRDVWDALKQLNF